MTPNDLAASARRSADAPSARSEPAAAAAAWQWAVAITAAVTLARLAAMRLSPLQLYADEAQYWLWSRHLAFGYFTKPPLIAWLIRLTTLGGDAEPFVRLSSPLLHGATSLLIYRAAQRLYEPATALFATLVYLMMPAVQLGAFVTSTDTPLVACLSAALWAYVALQRSAGRGRLWAAAAFGAAMGLAFLSKYAALYALIGVAAHLALSRSARRAWTPAAALLAAIVFVLLVAPNIAWNLANGLDSFRHVAADARWGERPGGWAPGLGFLGGQFGVFGPAPFAILTIGAVWLAWRRKLTPEDRLLLAWTLPALILVTLQAFVAGAKANWAAAAYAPGSILVGAWMLRWGRPRWLMAIAAAQALVFAAALVGEVAPQTADRVGLGVALRGVRGGREATQMIVERARAVSLEAPLSAVAIDDRGLFNLAAYYGRDYFGREGPPLKDWLAGSAPTDEAERASPLTPASGARVLAVSRDGASTAPMRAQFRRAVEVDVGRLWLGPKLQFRLDMFVGEGFAGATKS
jgi:4-amino-4-deoxy-L-arabinose transferase-like glycosyltransferase